MGAWRYLEPKLRELRARGRASCSYVGRPERASPAEGYPAAHAAEQSRIVREALGSRRSEPTPLETMAKAAGQGEGVAKSEGRPFRAALFVCSVPFAGDGRSDACRASSLSGSERCSP